MKGLCMNSLIIAPHPDDEIIGCFEILNDPKQKVTIIYDGETPDIRRKETNKLREVFSSVKNQVYHSSLPTMYVSKDVTIYAPDPVHEIHPLHRSWGLWQSKLQELVLMLYFIQLL
jgi:hypothetical protein